MAAAAVAAAAQRKCGKCEKTVYPAEELKCLDRLWHKGCFKCTTCGTTLNIKNAKGYEKLPYCNVHYPQPKSTVIADNPEMQRIRQLNEIQSNAKYHKDFNENKGKFTAVADDPATTRAREQQRNVSQAEYTGKRKDSASQVIAPENPPQATESNNNGGADTAEPSVGRVADYDPMNNYRGSLARGYEPTSKVLHGAKFESSQPNVIPPTVKPKNNENETSTQQVEEEPQPAKVEVQPPSSDVHHADQPKQDSPDETQSAQIKYRAVYSYVATEADEVSFNEDDILIECQEVDAGWMLGRNEKTGQKGLLPSNYVKIVE